MENAIAEATRELAEIHRKSMLKRAEKKSIIYENFPRLSRIERTLAHLGTQLVRSVFSKNKAELYKIKEKINRVRAIRDKLIKKNNIPEFIFNKNNCQYCADTGYVNGQMCRCLEALVAKYRFCSSGLIPSMKILTFDNFNYKLFSEHYLAQALNLYRTCQEMINSKKGIKNLLILGPTGTGKTYLSVSIANELIKNNIDIYFVSSYNLTELLRAKKFAKTEEGCKNARIKLKRVYLCKVLIIDDLGSEFANNLIRCELLDLIESRLFKRAATIINTNLTPKLIKETYMDRIYSRIVGEYENFTLNGPDLRFRKKSG